jgi:mRNA interferase MazF
VNPKPGEVYWVDLGLKAKYRPLMVVSRMDPDAPRALAACVPLTTEIKSGKYEVPLPRVRWMPGADKGVANVQGIVAVEHHRLERRAGRFEPDVIESVRNALAWMLELN